MGDARPARSRRRLIAGTVATLFAFASLLTGGAAAQAAEISGITSVNVPPADPDNPQLVIGDKFRVDATWSLPSNAHAGDTFSLSFPAYVDGITSTMNLLAGSSVVGTCTVGADALVCTLTDYVETHSDVQGTLFFYAVTVAHTDDTEFTFTTGTGSALSTPIPGGKLQKFHQQLFPEGVIKGGAATSDKKYVDWVIAVPSKVLNPQGGAPIVINDVATGDATFYDASFSVRYVDRADFNYGDNEKVWVDRSNSSAPGTYRIEVDQASKSFQLWINDPVTDDSRAYYIRYKTILTDSVAAGDVFTNTVTVDGQSPVTAEVVIDDGGGDGLGNALRSLKLTKQTDGDGVIPTEAFEFIVECTRNGTPVNGYPANVALASGESSTLTGIPVGSTCAIEETDSLGADSVAYSPASTVSFDTSSPAVTEVTATNTFLKHVGAVETTLQVAGADAALIDPETKYSVVAEYTVDSKVVTHEMLIKAGKSVALGDIPAGTEVTFEVLAPTPVAGGTYGDAKISGAGVTETGVGSATALVGDGALVQVLVEIPFTVPPAEPAPTQPAATAPDPQLAATGVSLDSVLIVSAALLVLVGGGLLVARRLARRNADAKQ